MVIGSGSQVEEEVLDGSPSPIVIFLGKPDVKVNLSPDSQPLSRA
jgi:hypothetical protein